MTLTASNTVLRWRQNWLDTGKHVVRWY